MNCFSGELASSAFSERLKATKAQIAKLQDRDMDNTDRDAWVDYFCSQCEIDALTIYQASYEIDLEEKTLAEYNHWHRMLPYGPEHYARPGIRATCKVPFTGDPELLTLQPNSHTLLPFEVDRIIRPGKDGIGYIMLAFEVFQRDATSEVIKKHFDDEIGSIVSEAERVNVEAARFNESFRGPIESAVDDRISQLDKLSTIRQDLNIPLNRVKDAPMAKPIPLPKKRLEFSRPKPREDGEASYSISDADYEAINVVIGECGALMEQAPGAYSALDEEQLRDIIRATLGTHWDNVSGETFRNRGKTDIYIPFESHAAYIAECKVWHGRKLFLKAIEQLFSYTTWRDTKVSVVVFNKENKSYGSVLSSIDNILNENAIRVRRVKDEVWTCKIQDPVDERVMHVTVLSFNLHVRPEVAK